MLALRDALASADLQRAATARDAAVSAFGDAERKLGSVLLLPARAVPGAGRNLRVLSAMGAAGVQVADAGRLAVEAASARPEAGWRVEGGRIDAEAVARAGRTAALARAPLERARAGLEDAPGAWLVPPLTSARQSALSLLDAGILAVDRTTAGTALVPALFGTGEPRRWFVAMANLSENRGSGGFWGFFGLLSAADGRLQLEDFDRPAVTLPHPDPARLDVPQWYRDAYDRIGGLSIWQSVNVAIDFPVAGGIAHQALRQPKSVGAVDGVIQIDPAGVAALLALSGPVSVPPWPEEITAQNVAAVTQHEVYLRFVDDEDPDFADRFGFVGDLTKAATRKILQDGVELTPEALAPLAQAAAGGHIRMWAARPGEQEALRTLGLAGDVARARAASDVLAVVGQNWAPTKGDWFLRRRVDYSVKLEPPTGLARASLSVTMRNEVDPASVPEPPYLGNTENGVPPFGNRQYVVVARAPADESGLFRIGGERIDPHRGREEDLRTYGEFVIVPAGESVTLDGQFIVIDAVRGTGRTRTYRLHVLRQPVAHPDDYAIRIEAPKGWDLIGPSSFSGPLQSDLVMDVRLRKPWRAWAADTFVLPVVDRIRSWL